MSVICGRPHARFEQTVIGARAEVEHDLAIAGFHEISRAHALERGRRGAGAEQADAHGGSFLFVLVYYTVYVTKLYPAAPLLYSASPPPVDAHDRYRPAETRAAHGPPETRRHDGAAVRADLRGLLGSDPARRLQARRAHSRGDRTVLAPAGEPRNRAEGDGQAGRQRPHRSQPAHRNLRRRPPLAGIRSVRLPFQGSADRRNAAALRARPRRRGGSFTRTLADAARMSSAACGSIGCCGSRTIRRHSRASISPSSTARSCSTFRSRNCTARPRIA